MEGLLKWGALLPLHLLPVRISPTLAAAASCDGNFYSRDGEAYALFQTNKVPNSVNRSIQWGLWINKADQKSYGKEVRVQLNSARVNYGAINKPYQAHYEAPDYNFHGSMKTYQNQGQSGGGTLKKGDVVYLEFGIVSMDTDASDQIKVSCTLD